MLVRRRVESAHRGDELGPPVMGGAGRWLSEQRLPSGGVRPAGDEGCRRVTASVRRWRLRLAGDGMFPRHRRAQLITSGPNSSPRYAGSARRREASHPVLGPLAPRGGELGRPGGETGSPGDDFGLRRRIPRPSQPRLARSGRRHGFGSHSGCGHTRYSYETGDLCARPRVRGRWLAVLAQGCRVLGCWPGPGLHRWAVVPAG